MEWGKTIKQVLDNVGTVEGSGSIPPPPTPVTYQLTTMATGNGSIMVLPKMATAGEKITVSVSPNNDYELAELYYFTSKGRVSLGMNTSFTMPDSDVKIGASFIAKTDGGNNKGGCKKAFIAFVWIAIIAGIIAMVASAL